MTSYAIYGANPAVHDLLPPFRRLQAWSQKAVADYFSGLNFGFIGSNETNPNTPGKTIGNSPSWTWYGNPPDCRRPQSRFR